MFELRIFLCLTAAHFVKCSEMFDFAVLLIAIL